MTSASARSRSAGGRGRGAGHEAERSVLIDVAVMQGARRAANASQQHRHSIVLSSGRGVCPSRRSSTESSQLGRRRRKLTVGERASPTLTNRLAPDGGDDDDDVRWSMIADASRLFPEPLPQRSLRLSAGEDGRASSATGPEPTRTGRKGGQTDLLFLYLCFVIFFLRLRFVESRLTGESRGAAARSSRAGRSGARGRSTSKGSREDACDVVEWCVVVCGGVHESGTSGGRNRCRTGPARAGGGGRERGGWRRKGGAERASVATLVSMVRGV